MSTNSRPNFLFLSFYLLALFGTLVMTAPAQTKNREYISPDRGARVFIVPVGKEPSRLEYESRIEFRSADDLLCAIDYSSEDSEHGFGVVRAEWTPDSQYFVFSLTSSGGHQAWHTPTQFFSRKDGIVRTLDDYFQSEITKAEFRLIAPNTVKTEILEGAKSSPVSVRLDAPPALRSWRRNKPFSLNCKGAAVIKVEQP
jgi:hypothetical protein